MTGSGAGSAPLLVTVFAGVLRFDRLSSPNAIIFDETYYAKDAWSILKHGVEWYWVNPASDPGYANNQIIAGHFSQHLFQACSGAGCGEYVVQPELGKRCSRSASGSTASPRWAGGSPRPCSARSPSW